MFTDTLKKTTEPFARLNHVMLTTLSKASEKQMESFREYSRMAGEQAKAATEIRDIEGVQDYLSRQSDFFNDVMEKASQDMKEMAQLAEEFRNEASQAIHPDADETVAPENSGEPQKEASTS